VSLQQVHTNRRIADIMHETDAQGRPVHVTGLKITGGGGDREEIREFDTIIAATDVPGIKKLLPASFRAGYPFFDRYVTCGNCYIRYSLLTYSLLMHVMLLHQIEIADACCAAVYSTGSRQ
jgi:hypothetical protein